MRSNPGRSSATLEFATRIEFGARSMNVKSGGKDATVEVAGERASAGPGGAGSQLPLAASFIPVVAAIAAGARAATALFRRLMISVPTQGTPLPSLITPGA